MEEVIVYVAGNPDAYPVEYYDNKTESFQGMIPCLLEEFSDQTFYDIRYYGKGNKDIRKRLADNLQVDMVSGHIGEDGFDYKNGKEIHILDAMVNGEMVSFRLFLLETAPDTLAMDLEGFLSETTQEVKTGLLLETAGRQSVFVNKGLYAAVLGLALVAAVLFSVMGMLIYRHRQRLRAAKQNMETDSLTGIGNMNYLEKNYRTFVNDRNRILYGMFYFYIDTENMEREEGRGKTDEFLRCTAFELLNHTSDTDILARVCDGGFVLLRLCPSIQEAEEWAAPVLERIAIHGNGGVSIYRMKEDEHVLKDVIFQASQAAKAAYAEGETYKICTEEWRRMFRKERGISKEIETGLKQEEFYLYIRFYVGGETRDIVGGEALLYWEHPSKGVLLPDQYLPLMDKKELICSFDYYLLEKACAFLESLREINIENFPVFCNFSVETFVEEGVETRCEEILEKYTFPRELLIFKIVGNSPLENIAALERSIKAVRHMGIQVAGGLFEREEKMFDILLLDKEMVHRALTDMGRAVLQAAVDTGHKLKMVVFAAGVETKEQAAILWEMGYDILQGDYFHYPAPEWEIKRELAEMSASKG